MCIRDKEVGLHVHLLDVELAGLDLLMHPLVAGVEAACVAAHGHQARLPLQHHHGLAFGQHVAQRNLHPHVLAGPQAGQALRSVQLRGRAQNHRVQARERQAVGQVGGDVGNAVPGGHFVRLVQVAADQRHTLHAFDQLDGVQVLDAKGSGARQGDLDRHVFSRIRWPTAVLEAGTWKKRWRTRGGRSLIAPRAISHITSSMPSLPASRT